MPTIIKRITDPFSYEVQTGNSVVKKKFSNSEKAFVVIITALLLLTVILIPVGVAFFFISSHLIREKNIKNDKDIESLEKSNKESNFELFKDASKNAINDLFFENDVENLLLDYLNSYDSKNPTSFYYGPFKITRIEQPLPKCTYSLDIEFNREMNGEFGQEYHNKYNLESNNKIFKQYFGEFDTKQLNECMGEVYGYFSEFKDSRTEKGFVIKYFEWVSDLSIKNVVQLGHIKIDFNIVDS